MDSYKAAQIRVKKRLKKRKEFFINFTAWIIICSMLLLVNVMVTPGHWWVLYPFLGWGISVAFQGYAVFGRGVMSDDWEERMIKKEMEDMGYPDYEEPLDLSSKPKMRQKRQAWDDSDLV